MLRVPPPPPDPLEVELLGELFYCWSCEEYWPADEAFFQRDRRSGNLRGPCRACMSDSKHKLEGTPCIVDGCNQTRVSWRLARCVKHQIEFEQERKRRKQCSTA